MSAVRFGSVRFVIFNLSAVCFGSVRFRFWSSLRFGSVRFRSTLFSLAVRFGSVCIGWYPSCGSVRFGFHICNQVCGLVPCSSVLCGLVFG